VLKKVLKRIARAFSIAIVLPCAALAAFGRFQAGFEFSGHILSLMPGLPGSYLRVAYYFLTLDSCSLESHIGFGTFFSRSKATLGRRVYVGSFCILGNTIIGDRTQIASAVQVLSGRRQHGRDLDGRILGADENTFQVVHIGADCWIGAGAIVMDDVGEGSTIGAGSIVTSCIPPRSLAYGNPARVVKSVDKGS